MKTFKKMLSLTVLSVILVGSSTANAADILIYSNEIFEVETDLEVGGNNLILDANNAGGDIVLQFGTDALETLETISWNNVLDRFEISDDLFVDGDLIVSGDVEFDITIDNVDPNYVLDGNGTLNDYLNDINNEIGDRNYLDENYVTDGQTITESIDALDQAIGNGVSSISVGVNDATVVADGNDNRANIYAAYDEVDDHEYYYLRTRQALTQDLELKYKVMLPEDFESFVEDGEAVSFYYRNENSVDANDSKVDITVSDKDGDEGFAANNLFSALWTKVTSDLNLNPLFDPANADLNGDRYVVVTVKMYGVNGLQSSQPNAGEIVLRYNTR
jgi:archaellum component FlaC